MSEPEVEDRPERRVGWQLSRQRLVEMTVVIFGVLIALGLENLVEEIRLRGDARRLEQDFQTDIVSAVRNSLERQMTAPCQIQTLMALTERVVASDGGWQAAPTVSAGTVALALPAPYRAASRIWTTASFDRALGSEAFKRIPRERAETYSVLFAGIGTRREANSAEYFAISSLTPLAFSQANVDAEVRTGMLQNLALADRHRALALIQANQFIEQALSLTGDADIRPHILASRSDFEEGVDYVEANYGTCVDRGAFDRLMKQVAF
jgi:hypothetical protein